MLKIILFTLFFMSVTFEFTCLCFLITMMLVRKDVKQQTYKVRDKLLCTQKKRTDIFMDVLYIGYFFIVGLLFLIIIFLGTSIVNPAFFMAIYSVFVTLLSMPNIFDMIKEGKRNEFVGLNVFFTVASIVLALGDKLEVEENSKRVFMVVSLSLYVMLIICRIIHAYEIRKRKSVSKFHKKIYKDLYYRTPRLSIHEMTYANLRKECEKYYSMYIENLNNYNKKQDLWSIRFGTPYNKGDDWYWYRRVAKLIKGVVLGSELAICANALVQFQLWQMWFAGGFLILYIWLYVLDRQDKKEGQNVFKRIIVRIYYDEWGYFLIGKRIKFVGTIQLLEIGRRYRLIHSMLNIASLCRIAAFEDLIYGKNNISKITNEMYELIVSYSENKNWKWFELIPILIAALFEYNNTGMVSSKFKHLLQQCDYSSDVKYEIKQFLEGLWIDVTGNIDNLAGYIMIQGFLKCFM